MLPISISRLVFDEGRPATSLSLRLSNVDVGSTEVGAWALPVALAASNEATGAKVRWAPATRGGRKKILAARLGK